MNTFTRIIICSLFIILFAYDYTSNNSLIEGLKTLCCSAVCFIKKVIRQETERMTNPNNPISGPIILIEVLLLICITVFFNRYKKQRKRDRIMQLLQESKEDLRQTNEFLEKWRLRRDAKETSYLDEEPEEIQPYKLEVPILHMAIIDTLGTTRSPESGDAGETVNCITDTTLLSVTSLVDGDLETPDHRETLEEKVDNADCKGFLWNDIEETGFVDKD